MRDVNYLKRELTVRRGMTIGEDFKRITSTTKTKKVRTIPIPQPLLPILEALAEDQKPSSSLFRGSKSLTALNDGWFRKAIYSPAVKSCGLTGVTVHTLRHTAASLLISSGASITTVAKILGHESVVQTLNTYGHFYKSDIEATMSSLSKSWIKVEKSGSPGEMKALA